MLRTVSIAAVALGAAACFTGEENPLPADFGQCDEAPPAGMAPAAVLTCYTLQPEPGWSVTPLELNNFERTVLLHVGFAISRRH